MVTRKIILTISRNRNFREFRMELGISNRVDHDIFHAQITAVNMGKGKKWSTEELKHLAEAWISISEDSGEAMVKGTNQDSDEFWRRIYNVFISKLQMLLRGMLTVH